MTSLFAIALATCVLGRGQAREEPAAAGTPARPNVVVLLADDLGYGDLSCYGGWIPTPNIDALARSGARFTAAYAAAPVCTPSRAGLLSGLHPQRFGVEFNTGPNPEALEEGTGMPGTVVTLPERLKGLGYVTACLGKWHLGMRPEMHPSAQGFDEFYGFLGPSHPYLPGDPFDERDPLHRLPAEGHRRPAPDARDEHGALPSGDEEREYLTAALAREAASFFARHRAEPFFLYVAFNAPHVPYQAEERWLARFPELTGEKRTYAAIVGALDEAVGQVLAALEREKLGEKTLVFFLSDNGAVPVHGPGSNAPLNLGKAFLLEGGVRVPLLARWPGRIDAGATVERPVSQLDIAPTVLGLAGAAPEILGGLDGRELFPLAGAAGAAGAGSRAFCWRLGPSAAIRLGDLKLLTSRQNRWLFDLARDPGETRDLSGDDPVRTERLERELERWLATLPPPAWTNRALEKPVSVCGKPYWVEF